MISICITVFTLDTNVPGTTTTFTFIFNLNRHPTFSYGQDLLSGSHTFTCYHYYGSLVCARAHARACIGMCMHMLPGAGMHICMCVWWREQVETEVLYNVDTQQSTELTGGHDCPPQTCVDCLGMEFEPLQ